jgi:hypothetical protein
VERVDAGVEKRVTTTVRKVSNPRCVGTLVTKPLTICIST